MLTVEDINNQDAIVLTIFPDSDGNYLENIKMPYAFETGEYTLFVSENGGEYKETNFFYEKQNPSVSIISPSSGKYMQSDLSEIEYRAENFSENFNSAVFYINGEQIMESTDKNGSFEIPALEGGNYTLTVKASDFDGGSAEASVNVTVAGSSVKPLVTTDFNSYTSGSPADVDSGSVASNGGYIQPVSIDEEHGQSVELGCNDGSSTGPFIGIPTGNTNDMVTLEADVYFPSENAAELDLTIRNQSTPDSLTLIKMRPQNKNEIYIPGTGGTALGGSFESDKWYRIKYTINGANNIFDLWISDGNETIQYASGRLGDNDAKVSVLNQLRFIAFTSNPQGGRVIIDNINSYITVNYPYITGFGSKKGENVYDDVVYDAEAVTVKLNSGVMSDSVKGNISLSSIYGEEEISSISVSQSGTEIDIVPKNQLKSNTEYTVTLNENIKMLSGDAIGYSQTENFTTGLKPLDVVSGEFKSNGNSVAFTPVVKNGTGNPQSIVSIINVWQDGKIIVSKAYSDNIGDGEEKAFSTEFVNVPAGAYAEGFVVNGLSGMRLVADNTFYYTANGDIQKSSALNTGYTADGAKLGIKGSANSAYAQTLISIVPEGMQADTEKINNKQAVLTTLYGNEKGEYSGSVGLSDCLEGGKYTMTAYIGGEKDQEYTFLHINPSAASNIIAQINSASSASAMGSIVAQNTSALGIDEDEYNQDAEYINTLLYAKKPVGGYTSISFYNTAYEAITASHLVRKTSVKETLKQYAEILSIDYQADVESLSDKIWNYAEGYLSGKDYTVISVNDALKNASILGKVKNVSRYTELSDIVINNAQYLGIDLNNSSANYNSVLLKDNVWKNFYKSLDKISDVDDVPAVFYKAVSDASDTEKNPGSNNGGGGSSGSSGGSGSSGSASGSMVTNTGGLNNIQKDTEQSKSVFSDIAGHWAQEIIENLSERNIIDGFEDGSFRPDTSVTRAQFCKMIVTALNLSNSENVTGFNDVNESDWYADYVYAASENGIVNGSDGYFMPNDEITRQDAAIMIFRALKSRGRNVFGSKLFDDTDSIADYAKDAVSALAASGIINGSDGKFNPLNTTTRAEAATMLYNLFEYLGE